jgi:hypothetical protein
MLSDGEIDACRYEKDQVRYLVLVISMTTYPELWLAVDVLMLHRVCIWAVSGCVHMEMRYSTTSLKNAVFYSSIKFNCLYGSEVYMYECSVITH